MKFLLASDAHGDRTTHGVDRYDEVARAFWETAHVAVREEVDLYAFLGDLANPDEGARTICSIALALEIAWYLRQHGVPSLWIAGNHDVDEGGKQTTLTPLLSIEGREDDGGEFGHIVAEEPLHFELKEKFHVVALPYTAVVNKYDPAEYIAGLKQPPDVVLAHATAIEGVKLGEESTEMARGRGMPFPFAATRGAKLRANGHYHRAQRFDPGDGGPPLIIPGSLARLAFGEESNTPSYVIAEVT